MSLGRKIGTPKGKAAIELIESGFRLECDDAPYLHYGLNLADLAHVFDLQRRDLIPEDAARELVALLLQLTKIPAAEFPYDPQLGEPYNSREAYFVERIGNAAGWLHAGRPRREAARIALRLGLRQQLVELVDAVLDFGSEICELAAQHSDTLMADQTYLQQAQPSTFGHYLLSFAPPAVRDVTRLLAELHQLNSSPSGAGCVNGTRLQDDRSFVAQALGFDAVITHTRDAMWRVDDLISVLAITTSVMANQSKLAEDLEIFSSSEFDFVDLDDAYSRSSVLMPNKRNPYALSIVRGASGVLIGRMSGFLAVTKSPSARSDNFIYAYGEVPRALELAQRVTALMAGVVRTLQVHPERMMAELERGYAQSTDLAEYLTTSRGVDYRTAYYVVGDVVRELSKAGVPGLSLNAAQVNAAALAHSGERWQVTDAELADVLPAGSIVDTRRAEGGAAAEPFARMLGQINEELAGHRAVAARARTSFTEHEDRLLAKAAQFVTESGSR